MNIEIPSEVRRIQQSQLVTPQQLQDTIMRVLTMNRAITETSVLNELVEEGCDRLIRVQLVFAIGLLAQDLVAAFH